MSLIFVTHFSFLQILCLKLAREQIGKDVFNGTGHNAVLHSHAQHSTSPTPAFVEATPMADNSSLTSQGEPSSPISVAPVVTMASSKLHSEMTPGLTASPAMTPINRPNVDEVETPVNAVTQSDSNVDGASVADVNTAKTPTYFYHTYFSSLLFYIFFMKHYFNFSSG